MYKIGAHYEHGTLRIASERYQKVWNMRCNFLSPGYTTNWADILKVS